MSGDRWKKCGDYGYGYRKCGVMVSGERCENILFKGHQMAVFFPKRLNFTPNTTRKLCNFISNLGEHRSNLIEKVRGKKRKEMEKERRKRGK